MDDHIRRARDEWIALRCQHGEPEAFTQLVGEMERPLFYFAQKLMGDEDRALDVLQEVWLKAFRTIHRLEKPSLVRTWLYQLTRGLAVDRWRRDAADDERIRVHAEHWSEVDDEPSFDQEDAARLHRALDKLEVKYREVLVLHFLEEMPIAQIAAVVSCPVGTVKSRLHYAKRALKAALGGERHGNET